jgi:ribokinase
VTTVLNPAPFADLPAELRRLVDVVVANEVEAEQLTGLSCTEENLSTVAARLCAEHARLGAVVTLGGRGAAVLDGAGVLDSAGVLDRAVSLVRVPAHAVDPVDTVGAGDAFCGVLAARLAAGDPLTTAVRHANAAGALATTRPGAVPAMPYADAIAPLLAAEAQPLSG